MVAFLTAGFLALGAGLDSTTGVSTLYGVGAVGASCFLPANKFVINFNIVILLVMYLVGALLYNELVSFKLIYLFGQYL